MSAAALPAGYVCKCPDGACACGHHDGDREVDAIGSAVCPDCSTTLAVGLVIPDSRIQCGSCGAVLIVRLEAVPIRAEDLRS